MIERGRRIRSDRPPSSVRAHFIPGGPRGAGLAALLALLACSGDGPTDPPPGETVASVEISPGSVTLRALTASTRLTATPRSASGAAVSGVSTSWTSSDSTVATVAPDGTVTAVTDGAVVASATVQGVIGTAAVAVTQRATTVTVTPSPLVMDALGETRQLEAAATDSLGQMVHGTAFAWSTSDAAIVTVTDGIVTARGLGQAVVSASAAGLSGSARAVVQERAASVALSIGARTLRSFGETTTLAAQALSSQGVPISGAVFSFESANPGVASISSSGMVTAKSNGSTVVTARTAGAEASLTVDVVQSLATLEVRPVHTLLTGPGQSADLDVVGADALGNEMAITVTRYEATDPAVATVSGSGRITAVGGGAAGIEIEADGLVAVAAVTVGNPNSWSSVPEWTTFQGNTAHTGYVPVVLDPNAFVEAWTASLAPGTDLNPVTSADGTVAVSTRAYYRTQLLFAVDEATGAPRWSYDFGEIHGVDPPASGNGRIYVTTSGHGDSFLWAFDPANGDPAFRSSFENQWSRAYAPVVVGSDVFMNGGYYGGMYAFDGDTGEERWFVALNQYDEWTPAVGDGMVYAYTGDDSPNLTVVDGASGEKAYEIPDPDFRWSGWSMNTAPVLGGRNDLLAVQSGRLVSFDLASRSVGWVRTAGFEGTLAVADEVIYVLNGGALEARAEFDGALLWVWVPPNGAKLRGAPVVTDNLVLVTSGNATWAVHLGSRRAVWSLDSGGHLALTPSGRLLLAGQDGVLTALRVRPS